MKFLLIILRYLLATFVFTFMQNGGLNHIIFRDLDFVFFGGFLPYVNSLMYPLAARASSSVQF